jgi:hypothetical protein
LQGPSLQVGDPCGQNPAYRPARPPHVAMEDPTNPAVTWRYQLDSDGSGGTIVRYRAVMGPGPSGLTARIAEMPDLEERIIAGRLKEHERDMMTTLQAIKRAAEGG